MNDVVIDEETSGEEKKREGENKHRMKRTS